MSTSKVSSSALPSKGLLLENKVLSTKKMPQKKLSSENILQSKMQAIKNAYAALLSKQMSSSKMYSKRMKSKKISVVNSFSSCYRGITSSNLIFSDPRTTKLYRGFLTYFVNESYLLKANFLNYLSIQLEVEDVDSYRQEIDRFLERHPNFKK
ncbi:hypothetical protein ACKWTF_008373 [Chironomus riparius]